MDRERNNPFEPGNQDPPVTVSIIPGADEIELSWSLDQEFLGLQGFRIYRAVNNLEGMAPYQDVPANQFSWQDTAIQAGNWYFYRITALGVGIESAASGVVKSYPGPGTIWVLSTRDQSIRKTSYDLVTQFEEIVTPLPALSWTNQRGRPVTWLTAAQFDRGLILFDRISGHDEFHRVSSFLRPVDICQNTDTGLLYVLDSQAARIFFFSQNGDSLGERSIPEGEDYLKIGFIGNPARLAVLSEQNFRIYPATFSGTALYLQSFPDGYRGQDFDNIGTRYFILAPAPAENRAIIYRWEGGPIDQISYEENYYRLRSDPAANALWIARDVPNSDDFVLQLSSDGIRQNALQDKQFKQVSDIAVNPYDGSVIVVDLPENILYLFRNDGALISEAKNNQGAKYIFQPIRVFIE